MDVSFLEFKEYNCEKDLIIAGGGPHFRGWMPLFKATLQVRGPRR